MTRFFLRLISSSKLALVLVCLIILFSIIGAILPQEGVYSKSEIEQWQVENNFVTSVAKPLGFFKVFVSIPFLVIILLLAINTSVCTVLEFFKRGGISAFRGKDKFKSYGFFLLHLSIVLIIIIGGWSAAVKMDGTIILTEGQRFVEDHKNYGKITEGPFRVDKHKKFVLQLNKVINTFEQKNFLVRTVCTLSVFDKKNKPIVLTTSINKPVSYSGVHITPDETGYSPHMRVRDLKRNRIILNSFIALKTFMEYKNRTYKDFIPNMFFKNKIILTLFPSYVKEGDTVVKSGENVTNPIMMVEEQDKDGEVISKKYLELGKSTVIDDLELTFAGLRQWSSFRLLEDPGYKYFWFVVWLSVISLILRYSGDIFILFKKDRK